MSASPTSSQVREEEEARLVALLDRYHAEAVAKRRLKLEAIVSHGDRLAQAYKSEVQAALQAEQVQVSERLERQKKEDAGLVKQVRALEKELLELLATRSDTLQEVATAVEAETAAVVHDVRDLAGAIGDVARGEQLTAHAVVENLFLRPRSPTPELGGSQPGPEADMEVEPEGGAAPEGGASSAAALGANKTGPAALRGDQPQQQQQPQQSITKQIGPSEWRGSGQHEGGSTGATNKQGGDDMADDAEMHLAGR
ncbi:hypothetical protein JCM8202_003621 [Rhodotorula sphaerocarpa]